MFILVCCVLYIFYILTIVIYVYVTISLWRYHHDDILMTTLAWWYRRVDIIWMISSWWYRHDDIFMMVSPWWCHHDDIIKMMSSWWYHYSLPTCIMIDKIYCKMYMIDKLYCNMCRGLDPVNRNDLGGDGPAKASRRVCFIRFFWLRGAGMTESKRRVRLHGLLRSPFW